MRLGTPPARVPVSLLTGCLGSGKTTLLAHLLRQPAMVPTAVIINEYGELALDQHLVGQADALTMTVPGGDCRSRLVFITQGLSAAMIEAVLDRAPS